jgi:leucyl-tRNA synthetase
MDYNFRDIEKKWQDYWANNNIYKVDIDKSKPKFFVLDMFPYPSGAGLHVGHPLGYIASDIYARYKKLKGFNVLHPMGYDAYGLPAEQYAIQTGQHPAITTENNIKRYREQLDKLGFCFDWNREVRTSDPMYYKWTQWTFLQLYKSWYDKKTNKAESIDKLIKEFEINGSTYFTSSEWKTYNEKKKQEILMNYRLAYLSDSIVNWCPDLGTVLANDEVVNGYSVRGGHAVERKLMKQWSLRITAYADRLLEGLDRIDWSESIKEVQRNWIGRSEGATVYFEIENLGGFENLRGLRLEIFTTRPDTLFGCTFMVLCPEHDIIEKITPPEYKDSVLNYVSSAKNRSERERQADIKTISGVFTGAYCKHPFIEGKKLPIWVADYVLAGYGSGAIMSVPAHDSRDYAFAKHFNIPIQEVITGGDISKEAYEGKEGTLINSGFLNGLNVKDAISTMIKHIEQEKLGFGTVNYRLRDAIFSRQRYWGEPFPIYYKDGIPFPFDESELPLELPEVDKYLPTETGEPPLARAKNWKTKDGYQIETGTMPGFAGSSGYYLRYMDSHNDKEYVSKEANEYWENVDLYIGGAEHATGHLIYARFWNKFLFDLGLTCKDEPFKKMINQGMIQGRSSLIYRLKGENRFVSYNLKDKYDVFPLNVDVNLVENDVLDVEGFKKWRADFADAKFILEDGKYICGYEIDKMSKSKYNVVNPDDLLDKYGADTLRMYEMFLGPLEQHKPWDTKGIEGVFRFIKKLWKLYHDTNNNFLVSDEEPTKEELKSLHKAIKKVQEDIERYSFNTGVSTFMICVNELTELKCNKRAILEPLTILLSPYAPHIAEELYFLLIRSKFLTRLDKSTIDTVEEMGLTDNFFKAYKKTITNAQFPQYNEEYLKENSFSYPVSFNGKMRFNIELPIDMPVAEIEKIALSAPESQKWLDGKTPKKIIIVPKKIINIVI